MIMKNSHIAKNFKIICLKSIEIMFSDKIMYIKWQHIETESHSRSNKSTMRFFKNLKCSEVFIEIQNCPGSWALKKPKYHYSEIF